jgi:hypothetical protein
MIRELLIGALIAVMFFMAGFWLGGEVTSEFPATFMDYRSK